jgi:hypothetical protein
MKLDLEVETAENGMIVTINGARFICRDERSLARKIIAFIHSDKPPVGQYSEEHNKRISDSSRMFQSEIIGDLQKEICEIIEKDGYSTIDKITDILYESRNYKSDKWSLKGYVKGTVKNLLIKGFLRKTNKNANKLYLTDKRPKGYIEHKKKDLCEV